MKKYKLSLALNGSFGLRDAEQIELMSKVGFDGLFFGWSENCDVREIVRAAEKFNIEIGSAHAPFLKASDMWETGERAEAAVSELLSCLADCSEFGIPTMVAHTFIGFDRHSPNENGLRHFERVAETAERLNVNLALENTEGEEYFDALMSHFEGNNRVGFCFDSGHELCYNRGRDLLGQYGDRLMYTHLNDNLGVCGSEITYLDDLHLLPFDGKVDFRSVASRLAKAAYLDTLTFELTRQSKPGRHENDVYARMGIEDYLATAYERAQRFRGMVEACVEGTAKK